MNGGTLPANQLHDINWGVLDHTSHVRTSCVSVHVPYACVCVNVRACELIDCTLIMVWSLTAAAYVCVCVLLSVCASVVSLH